MFPLKLHLISEKNYLSICFRFYYGCGNRSLSKAVGNCYTNIPCYDATDGTPLGDSDTGPLRRGKGDTEYPCPVFSRRSTPGLLNWLTAVRIRTFQVLKLDLKLHLGLTYFFDQKRDAQIQFETFF